MLLVAKYKSGQLRRVNLHPAFFASYDTPISKRALDFGYMHGSDLYQISVQRGAENMFEQTFRQNAPETKFAGYDVDETKVKKALRKKHKNDKFTTKVILQG
jgi:hypothetical protein